MKYVLVDREDDIVDRVELTSDIGVSGARTFFVGRKQIESEKFDQIWKVMAEIDYNRNKERKYKYEESGDWLDIEKSQ
jgi:hypothetical protein